MLKFLNILLLQAVVLFASTRVSAQNFVGMKESAIIKKTESDLPSFKRESDYANERFRYLKYTTADGLQTMLIFLDSNGICTEVRISFDRSIYNEMVKDLNRLYSRSSDNVWTDTRKGRRFSITLSDDTWYYTVRFEATGKS